MGETVSGFLQFGALGALVVLLLLIYKLALPIVTAWVSRKTDIPPPANIISGNVPYNDQFARTIYDVNKTLSEMAVNVEQTQEILKRSIQVGQETLQLQREHNQKSGAFIDTLGQTLISRIG